MRLILIVLALCWCIFGRSGAHAQGPDSRQVVVFIGSSSIARWQTLPSDFPAYHTVNLGLNGDAQRPNGQMIAGVSALINTDFTRLNPWLVVIYAGENDLWGGNDHEYRKQSVKVCGDYKRLVKKIHRKLPRTRIVGVSIKLSPRRMTLRDEIVATNTCIRAIAEHPYFRYADTYKAMLDPDGNPNKNLFAGDGLHMNDRGYALWHDLIVKSL